MRTFTNTYGELEPITLEEAKNYARVLTGSLEDITLTTMIQSARRACEEYARFSIVQREWSTTYRPPRAVPYGMGLGSSLHDTDNVMRGMRLPRRPVQSLTSLVWTFVDGTTEEATDYFYDANVDRIQWSSLPTPGGKEWSGLTALYQAGFPPLVPETGDPVRVDAPAEVRMAVLITVAHYYETRSMGSSSVIPSSAKEQLRGWWQSASVA